ncbi:MAG: prepilin-type N-terminal cleavage/methylation domain-containing protein [Bacteroidales bacterium]|nr:prepilin-type N-terminal cleavage/methylation domain-containing protein [Bacteroidales bacterium]
MKKRIIIKINRKGFSLIEMMVALGILSLLIIGSVTFFSGGTRSWVTGQYQLEAQRNARFAMDRMVKEIREGKNIGSGSSETSITVLIPHFDADGNIDSDYTVTYALIDDTTIQRDTNPLIENVLTGEAIFKYYNNSDTEVTSPDATVSKIHINLKVDVDKDDSPDITLNTDVSLRNFGLQ